MSPTVEEIVDHELRSINSDLAQVLVDRPVNVSLLLGGGLAGVKGENLLQVGRSDANPPAGTKHAKALAKHCRAGLIRQVLDDVLIEHVVNAAIFQRKWLRGVEITHAGNVLANIGVQPAVQ